MIYLGKIVKTRSNKGEVVFQPDPNSGHSVPSGGDTVTLKSPKHQKSIKIEYISEKHGNFVIKFTGIDTIQEAYPLIGYSIYTTAETVKTEPQKSIIGFQVIDQNGLLWGKVGRIEDSDVNPLMEIETGENPILVPYHPKIIITIDHKKGEILINPPQGLKDLNSP